MRRFAPALLPSAFFALLLTALLPGCVTTQQQAPAPPEEIVQSYQLPVFESLAESKRSQSKGGLRISVTPVNYKVSWKTDSTMEEAKPSFGQSMAASAAQGASGQRMRFVRVEKTPVPSVTPNRLRFRVRINNQMPRVFRGSGTVVQFNIDGKLINVDQEGYQSLANAIVPPRSETTLEIYGPKLSDLPKKANLGLFFYDVVTDQSEAGEVTERQNFEWYYEYLSEARSDTVTVESKEGWISVGNGQGQQEGR